jgi:hypothetical protein
MEAVFEESSATHRIEAMPLSHLSLELGHLYMEDFQQGLPRLTELFEGVAPWARTAEAVCGTGVAPGRPRISTCFLIDDYFQAFSTPAEVIPMILTAAGNAGLRIDYIAREACCVEAHDVPLAELVTGRLVASPPPGTTGSRPPVHETGWLSNGERSPELPLDEAMRPTVGWQPPSESGANRHSIFVDVELWADGPTETRLWSCPFLAAVWQLLRLGALRMRGRSVVRPQLMADAFPGEWKDLPPIIQLRPDATPFSAYRTFSVLGNRFLPIELSVRTILSQVDIEHSVREELAQRCAAEKLTLPEELVSRIEYAFVGSAWRGPAHIPGSVKLSAAQLPGSRKG